MQLTTTQLVLWISLIAGEAVVLGAIAYRRAWRQYPHFALYIGYCLVRSLALFTISRVFPSVYFWAYFVGMAMGSVAVLACVSELLGSLFITKRHVPKFGCTFAVLFVLCVALSIAQPNSTYPRFVVGLVEMFDRAVSWFILAAFVKVIVTSRHFGIPWKLRPFRIAIGLFVACLAYSATRTLGMYTHYAQAARYLHMLAFLAAEVIWIAAYVLPDSRLFVVSENDLARVRPLIPTTNILTHSPKRAEKIGA